MNTRTIIKSSCFAAVVAAAALTVGCQPDEVTSGNALYNEDIDASFTVTQIDGSANRLRFTASPETTHNIWNLGLGNPEAVGPVSFDMFYPDAGTYTVTHKAIGSGGVMNTTTQTIQVATPDPIAGNLILNGKFVDGNANWSVANISASGAEWTFTSGASGAATIVASGWNQKALYQAVQVEGGKEYNIDMKVSGQGAQDTWFEVYVSTVRPVDGQEYNAAAGSGPVRFALNTWAGCATAPFSGVISQVGCGDHTGNPITFPASGTVYFVIKCGGANTGAISVDNIEFRRKS